MLRPFIVFCKRALTSNGESESLRKGREKGRFHGRIVQATLPSLVHVQLCCYDIATTTWTWSSGSSLWSCTADTLRNRYYCIIFWVLHLLWSLLWYRYTADFRRCSCACPTPKLWPPLTSLVRATTQRFDVGRLISSSQWQSRYVTFWFMMHVVCMHVSMIVTATVPWWCWHSTPKAWGRKLDRGIN